MPIITLYTTFINYSTLILLFKNSYFNLPVSILFFLNKKFIKQFFLNFKNLLQKEYGLYTNNLTKSINYWILKDLVLNITSKDTTYPISTKCPSIKNNHTVKYLQPVLVLNFAFNKKFYNMFIIFLLNLFSTYYYSPLITFTLNHSFIFYKTNFKFLFFSNIFYFKIFNY